jgi:hypothetical protein
MSGVSEYPRVSKSRKVFELGIVFRRKGLPDIVLNPLVANANIGFLKYYLPSSEVHVNH